MNKEFFERKVKELDDDKLIALLKIKNDPNQEIHALAKEEAKRRNLEINPEDLTSTALNLKFHQQVEESNKLEKWSWGAFLLAPFWTLANGLSIWWFLALFIPILNIIIVFYLGFNGNRLAYEKSNIDSVDDFMGIQKEWNKWGVRFFWLVILITIVKLMTSIITD